MIEIKEKLEKLIGFELVEVFNSVEDPGCEDEENGEFITYEPNIGGVLDPPPVINIYENGKIQFFHDASPYPVRANSDEEARWMMMALIPAPVDFEDLQPSDFSDFLNGLLEEYGE
jgi:hypothetical protein